MASQPPFPSPSWLFLNLLALRLSDGCFSIPLSPVQISVPAMTWTELAHSSVFTHAMLYMWKIHFLRCFLHAKTYLLPKSVVQNPLHLLLQILISHTEWCVTYTGFFMNMVYKNVWEQGLWFLTTSYYIWCTSQHTAGTQLISLLTITPTGENIVRKIAVSIQKNKCRWLYIILQVLFTQQLVV